ncbi:MAG: prepilin-type N-terminal cleavage/methylation domain-containing protein [Planctomycetota bacterium]|nr:prepilin-type N-terminal cleavage/methylation domain-containing protein [Planctomycetota bacterium]
MFRASRGIRGVRGFRGFTLVELLVTIALIGVLVGLLLPALSKAWNVANIMVDAANMQQIGRGIAIYAADNSDFAPLFGGFSQNDDAPNGDCAGASIWGLSPGGVTALQNAPMGLGVLVPSGGKGTPPSYAQFGTYVTSLDVLFSPNDRSPTRDADNAFPNTGPYASFWALRDWYGDTRITNWNKQGKWGFYVTGTNYGLDSSYIYRGDDYSWYNPAISTGFILSKQTSVLGNTVVTGLKRAAARANARQSSDAWGNKSIMMNRTFNMLDPLKQQANVMRGDYSVRIENNPAWLTHLANTSVAKNWYIGSPNYFESRKFALLDYYQGY